MYTYYKDYFKHINIADFQKELEHCCKELAFPAPVVDEAIISLALNVIQSGYFMPFYEDDRLINRLSGEEQFRIFCLLLPPLKAHYSAQKMPLKIYFDTLTDMIERAQAYQAAKGLWGFESGEAHWLLRIFTYNIFKIGSLQYEVVRFAFDKGFEAYHWTESKLMHAMAGRPLLSIHIMRGEDLSPEAVDKSLKEAAKLLNFEHYAALICNSWMLYTPLQKYLQEGTNIEAFSERFVTIGNMNDPNYAKKSVFPCQESIEKMTSLQRTMKKHPETMGMGFGVLKGLSKIIDNPFQL